MSNDTTKQPDVPFRQRYNDTDTLTKCGLVWLTESVSKQKNKNASQRYVVCDHAQILHIANGDAFYENWPDAKNTLVGMSRTSSLRVAGQRINRLNPDKTDDERRSMVWDWLLNCRHTATVTVQRVVETRTVHSNPLPSGMYTGTDENEYRAQYTVELVERGVPTNVAMDIARTVPFNGIVPSVASDETDDDETP